MICDYTKVEDEAVEIVDKLLNRLKETNEDS